MEDKEKYNERLVRWQKIAIEERGKIITLVITLSLATIGFVLSQAIECTFQICFARSSCAIGIFVLLVCVIVALVTTYNRFEGFRKTMDIIKERKLGCPDGDSYLQRLKTISENNDNRTRNLFNWTLGLFCVGELLTITGMIVEFHSKFIL